MLRARLIRLGIALLAVTLAVTFLAMVVAIAADDKEDKFFEGTVKADLDKLTLPEPGKVKAAILPFWDYKSSQRHIDVTTESCRELLERHGFALASAEAAASALKADKELEPGQPLRRADAIRIGKQMGVDWVVYGEVYELETYVKTSFLSSRKKGKISLKLSVADIPAGEVIYWHKRSDTSGGTGFANLKRGAKVERKAAQVCITRACKLLLDSLPKHEVKPEKADSDEEKPAEADAQK